MLVKVGARVRVGLLVGGSSPLVMRITVGWENLSPLLPWNLIEAVLGASRGPGMISTPSTLTGNIALLNAILMRKIASRVILMMPLVVTVRFLRNKPTLVREGTDVNVIVVIMSWLNNSRIFSSKVNIFIFQRF